MELNEFNRTSADWRRIIKINTSRTYFVIGSFIVLYAALGLMIDLYLNANRYPNIGLGTLTQALLELQIFPTATVLLALLATIAVWITFAWHNRIMLLGTEYHEITRETARNTQEAQLYNVVEEMKIAAGLKYMPKVYMIEANYMNAFATGYSEKSSMVAITRGLMTKLNRTELQAVMAHELSHIRHLDIKLTLAATVLSNMTLIIIDLLFHNMIYNGSNSDEGPKRNNLFPLIAILRFVLPIITLLLIFYLSRTREYMADAGCVELMRDNGPLASALLKIQQDHESHAAAYSESYQQTPNESLRQTAYIFDPSQAGISNRQSLSDIFSTHPSIQKRLAALGFIKAEK